MFIAFGANLPGKFTDAEENESTSFLPGDAESTKALQAAEELQGGELAPAVIVYRREAGPHPGRPREDRPGRPAPDRAALPGRRSRRRHRRGGRAGRRLAGGPAGGAGQAPEGGASGQPEGCGGPTTPLPGQPAGYAPFVGPICSEDGKAAIVTAYLKGEGDGDRILDPVEFWRDTVSDPGGGPRGEDHGRRRLRGGRHRGLREHQRHAAAGGGVAGDRAADPHLPLADLPVHPAGGGDLRRDPGALGGLRALRARRHDQRAVQRDHVDPGAWRGHRLRAPDRGEIPRGAAPHVGPPRGHPGGDDLRRPRRVRPLLPP